MKMTLAWMVLVLVLSLFGASAVQVAGDDVPDGSAVPAVLYMAGDDVPDGG